MVIEYCYYTLNIVIVITDFKYIYLSIIKQIKINNVYKFHAIISINIIIQYHRIFILQIVILLSEISCRNKNFKNY